MNLVAEHRLRMLHGSPVYKQWSASQKQQTAPSNKLSIKIEQVLEVSAWIPCVLHNSKLAGSLCECLAVVFRLKLALYLCKAPGW